MEKAEIKIWLKSIRKNRYWLAEQTGVSKRGIDTWLSSSRPIPKTVEKVISQLMEKYPGYDLGEPQTGRFNVLALSVGDDVFDSWNSQASKEGKLMRHWAIDVLEQASGKSG